MREDIHLSLPLIPDVMRMVARCVSTFPQASQPPSLPATRRGALWTSETEKLKNNNPVYGSSKTQNVEDAPAHPKAAVAAARSFRAALSAAPVFAGTPPCLWILRGRQVLTVDAG
jgi:hypothetical protein